MTALRPGSSLGAAISSANFQLPVSPNDICKPQSISDAHLQQFTGVNASRRPAKKKKKKKGRKHQQTKDRGDSFIFLRRGYKTARGIITEYIYLGLVARFVQFHRECRKFCPDVVRR